VATVLELHHPVLEAPLLIVVLPPRRTHPDLAPFVGGRVGKVQAGPAGRAAEGGSERTPSLEDGATDRHPRYQVGSDGDGGAGQIDVPFAQPEVEFAGGDDSRIEAQGLERRDGVEHGDVEVPSGRRGVERGQGLGRPAAPRLDDRHPRLGARRPIGRLGRDHLREVSGRDIIPTDRHRGKPGADSGGEILAVVREVGLVERQGGGPPTLEERGVGGRDVARPAGPTDQRGLHRKALGWHDQQGATIGPDAMADGPLLKCLPHADSQANAAVGAWIHVAVEVWTGRAEAARIVDRILTWQPRVDLPPLEIDHPACFSIIAGE